MVIPAVQLREFFEPRVQLADFLLVQHHVLCVCNVSAQPFRNALGGIFTAELPVQVRNQPGKSALILYQGEGLALSVVLGIEGDDLGGDAVDGAELRNLRAVIPEQPGKALLHFAGGSPGIGHGQDLIRGDAAAAQHVAQTGHQYGGFPAAGHRQQQHRAVYGMDSFRLLRVKAPDIFPVKCFSVHVVTPSESAQISETLFNRFYHKLPGITIGAAQKRTLRPEAGGFVSLSKILFDKLKSIFKTFMKVLKMR